MNGTILDVIIVNWNGADVIVPCLRSLEKVMSPRLRVTVVDNASEDSSVEIIRDNFPDVEVIVNDRNLLFAEGNNVGIRHVLKNGGEYILLLNNDTEVAPDFAERMMEAASAQEVGIVGPKIYFFDDPRRIWYGGGDFIPGVWIPRHRNIRKIDHGTAGKSGETEWVTGCALMIKKEVIDDIGLLDGSYRIYCEDIDFCLRASDAGWKIYYQESAKVWHKVSSSSGGGMTPFKLENRIASTNRLFKVHRNLLWRLLLFPVHAFIFTVLLSVLFLSGRWSLAKGALKGIGRITAAE